jgi:hypothetical protein
MEIHTKGSDFWCVTPCCLLEIYYEEGGGIFLRKVCKLHSTQQPHCTILMQYEESKPENLI